MGVVLPKYYIWTKDLFSIKHFYRLGPHGQVGHRVAMSVCLCLCLSQKWKWMSVAKWIFLVLNFPFFKYKIEYVCMVLRILNLKGHSNCMISSKA